MVVDLAALVLPKPGWPDLKAALTDKWLGSAAGSPHMREMAMQVGACAHACMHACARTPISWYLQAGRGRSSAARVQTRPCA